MPAHTSRSHRLTMLVAALLTSLGVGCSSATEGSSSECPSGQVLVDRSCRTVCTESCEQPGTCCVDGACLPAGEGGCAAPVVLSVDGSGTADGALGHAARHVEGRLVIEGSGLEGATVTLEGRGDTAGSYALEACGTGSDTRLEVALPADPAFAPGDYLLAVANQAGACGTYLSILQGERGPEGPEGAAGLVAAGSVGSAEVVDGSLGAAEVIASELQLRVSGSCGSGSSIRAIMEDGSVACEPDDGGTAGVGADSVGSAEVVDGSLGAADVSTAQIQLRVAESCAPGSSVRAIDADGTVLCEPDDVGAQLSEAEVLAFVANDTSSGYLPKDNGAAFADSLLRDDGANVACDGGFIMPNGKGLYFTEQTGAVGASYMIYTNDPANPADPDHLYLRNANGSVVIQSQLDGTDGFYLQNSTSNATRARVFDKPVEGMNVWLAGNLVDGSNGLYVSNFQGKFRVVDANYSVENFAVTQSGVVSGTYGTYHAPSDARLKTDVRDIVGAVDKVTALRGVTYRWIDPALDDGGREMGLIAQEVEPIVPEVVHTADDARRTKSVEYQYLVALLIEAAKEQQAMIEAQEATLRSEERRIAALEHQLAALAAEVARIQGARR